MWSEEVIVCNEESGESNSPIGRVEAAGSVGMEFVSTVKAFHELFERTEFF